MTIHTSSKSNHQNALSPFEREFNGVWTAFVTPFKDDHSIDWHAWEKLLAMQAEGGVSGVVVSGTTGESPTLSVQEKISLVRKARAVLPKQSGSWLAAAATTLNRALSSPGFALTLGRIPCWSSHRHTTNRPPRDSSCISRPSRRASMFRFAFITSRAAPDNCCRRMCWRHCAPSRVSLP